MANIRRARGESGRRRHVAQNLSAKAIASALALSAPLTAGAPLRQALPRSHAALAALAALAGGASTSISSSMAKLFVATPA